MSVRFVSDCPAGCGRPVASGKLMCQPCWREVPKHLQRAVYATWRAYQGTTGDLARRKAYLAAREAAIGAVR